LLWQFQNDQRGCAWPSLQRIATDLTMNKCTVVRSLHKLQQRGWISKSRRGGRHRSNEYRIAFGSMGEDQEDGDGRRC
jgi:DNA-binding IclR family transcriptional regulator